MLWIVRLKRRSKKISLKEMSRLTGLTASTLSRIEQYPMRAKIGDLIKVCNILELDILEVMKIIKGQACINLHT